LFFFGDGPLRNRAPQARANGLGFGVVMGSFFGTYALGLWCEGGE
jgi:hypothetical protein